MLALEQMFQFPQETERDRSLIDLLVLLSEDMLAGEGIRAPPGLLAEPGAYLYLALMPVDVALALARDPALEAKKRALTEERRRLAHRIEG
jgi:hypothetical protein